MRKDFKRALAKRQEAEREERRGRILDAARRVFLRKGYLGASIRAIALEAELSAGLIYFYFGGKDEIYGRICEEAFRIAIGMLEEAASKEGPFRGRLSALARAYVRFYAEYPEYFDILCFKDMGFKRVGIPAEIKRVLDGLSQRALSIVKGVVKEGIEAGELPREAGGWQTTFALWSAIEGALYVHKRGYLDPAGVSLDALVDTQLRILGAGLEPGSDRRD